MNKKNNFTLSLAEVCGAQWVIGRSVGGIGLFVYHLKLLFLCCVCLQSALLMYCTLLYSQCS